MNVALVGFGVEGRSSYDYFTARGHQITICDRSTRLEVPVGVDTQLGTAYLDNLDKFDLIVRSAGINPQLLLNKNPTIADKITTQVNEFLRVAPTKHIIGITGTKGKGTTSVLTTQILRTAGCKVFIGGNIGLPVLSLIGEVEERDWVVLELSSFQLSDLRYAPHIAACLMITPEHLNWHLDFEEYVQAKANLFRAQKSNDIAIYYADDETSHAIARQSPGDKICYYNEPGAYIEDGMIKIDNQLICRTDELRLLGAHNWQNVCAAITVAWQAGVMDIGAIRTAVIEFGGLEHRLELVTDVSGIAYYDDSFGTTPETAIVALAAFDRHKVVILGGSDKGVPLQPLIDAVVVDPHVRHVITIGATGPAIARALTEANVPHSPGGETMYEIVAEATKHAHKGDVVLLSPGCASFGLFQNYKDRGDQFKDAVLRIV